MFTNKTQTGQPRRVDVLQKRCERLTDEYDKLKKENDNLRHDLEIYKAKVQCVKKAENEFMRLIDQTKKIKAQYEQAYESLKYLKKNYSSEMEKLIKQIKQ